MVNFTLPSTTSEMISISHITNFPFLSSNIPSSPAYGVFISQLIRYARACSSYDCFILRTRRLSSKLLKQGYLVERLKSSFRKFYGRYGDLIEQYGVTLSRMLNDILTPWPTVTSLPIRLSTNFMTFIPSLTFTRIMSGFHGAFATGVASQPGNAYPSGHLVPSPILGLANAPIVETKFLELAMSLLDFSPRKPLGTFSILLNDDFNITIRITDTVDGDLPPLVLMVVYFSEFPAILSSLLLSPETEK